jgi:hypothetical protein
LEIALHAAPEALCLADVNDDPLLILEEVDPGRRRKGAKFFDYAIGDHGDAIETKLSDER